MAAPIDPSFAVGGPEWGVGAVQQVFSRSGVTA